MSAIVRGAGLGALSAVMARGVASPRYVDEYSALFWAIGAAFDAPLPHKLFAGTHLAGGPFDGSADVTLTTDAVSANTASTIVARDSSGNFTAGTVTMGLADLIGGGNPQQSRWKHTAGDGYHYAGATHSANPDLVFYNASLSETFRIFNSGDVTVPGTLRSGVHATTTSGGVYGLVMQDTTSNTGINFKPTGANSAFLDVTTVGASLVGRVSTASSGDKTWLTVLSTGAVALGASLTLGAQLIVVQATSGYAISVEDTSGNTAISLKPAAASSAFIDNVRVGANTFFRCSSGSSADVTWLTVTSAGAVTFVSSITTAAPPAGSQGAWKLGTNIAGGPFTLDTGHYIEVGVNGTLYKLAVVT